MNGILQDCTMILTPLLMISVWESDTSGIMAGASLRQIVSRFARAAAALCTVCSLAGASAQVKQVVLVTLDWEPYIGQDLPGHGYVHEIVEEAFHSMGYRMEVHFYPWARALAVAEAGEADGLFPEYCDERRTARFT